MGVVIISNYVNIISNSAEIITIMFSLASMLLTARVKSTEL